MHYIFVERTIFNREIQHAIGIFGYWSTNQEYKTNRNIIENDIIHANFVSQRTLMTKKK